MAKNKEKKMKEKEETIVSLLKDIKNRLPEIPVVDATEEQESVEPTKEQRIEDLKKELREKDERLKANLDEPKLAIQIGLIKKGLIKPDSAMHDAVLERMKFDLEEAKIMIDSGMEMLEPLYTYQKDKRWINLQLDKQKEFADNLKQDIKEIESKVSEMANEINAQNGRIKERRIHILEDLEKLGFDVKELKNGSPNYIG